MMDFEPILRGFVHEATTIMQPCILLLPILYTLVVIKSYNCFYLQQPVLLLLLYPKISLRAVILWWEL